MRYLRARIVGVQTKSLRCNISKEEVTESELQNHIADGEHTYRHWIYDSMKATFSLRDPKLYDYALSLLNKQVLLGIEDGRIISIESVKESDVCHICKQLTLKRDFVENTRLICAKYKDGYSLYDDCKLAKDSPFLECVTYKEGVYKSAQSNGPLACKVESKYLMLAGNVYSDGSLYMKSTTTEEDTWLDNTYQIKIKVAGTESYRYEDPVIERTRITFTYKGHYVRACKKCNINREKQTFSLDNLKRTLYRDFAEGIKTYSIHNTVLTSWDNRLGVQTNK
ncbi:MAG: hypothetical protein M3P08_07665 [Thermoproteota archaeon]|nr:hypothetical protein [Thermoproteota archaeon]